MARHIEYHKTIGGTLSHKPLHLHPNQVPPAAQVGGGGESKTWGHWKEHRGQHVTGRQFRRTAGDNRSSWGGTAHQRKTGGEEARGGERDARAGRVAEDIELGRGNLGRGGEGTGRQSVQADGG